MINWRAVEVFSLSFSLSLLEVVDREEAVDNLGEFEDGSTISDVEKVAVVGEGE
jgi:hypothetical protein